MDMENLTWLHGKPTASGILKANPEDFVVVEDLGFEPDGKVSICWFVFVKWLQYPIRC